MTYDDFRLATSGDFRLPATSDLRIPTTSDLRLSVSSDFQRLASEQTIMDVYLGVLFTILHYFCALEDASAHAHVQFTFTRVGINIYSLFALRKPHSSLIINGDRGFLRVNKLWSVK